MPFASDMIDDEVPSIEEANPADKHGRGTCRLGPCHRLGDDFQVFGKGANMIAE